MINLTKKKYILEYELIDYNFENIQFFQGISTAFSNFDYCYYGIGNNQREAAENLLENLYAAIPDDINYYEIDTAKLEEELKEYINEDYYILDDDSQNIDNEIDYHVGIKFNLIFKISKKDFKTKLIDFLDNLNLSIPKNIFSEALEKIFSDYDDCIKYDDYSNLIANYNNPNYFINIFNAINFNIIFETHSYDSSSYDNHAIQISQCGDAIRVMYYAVNDDEKNTLSEWYEIEYFCSCQLDNDDENFSCQNVECEMIPVALLSNDFEKTLKNYHYIRLDHVMRI